MLKFSELEQAFYDLTLNYSELPDDLIDVTDAEHSKLLDAINDGYHVYADLTLSDDFRPNQFYEWNEESKKWDVPDEYRAAFEQFNAQSNLLTAETEYDRATDIISALTEQLDDEDFYEEETQESVTTAKINWVNYRKLLRAYINDKNGVADLPTAPDNESSSNLQE
ncbi:TPA: hypothetical protein IEP67_004892 [Escherichia coli]|nr:hypothetical protein [Escherichia coli]EHI1011843.1 hypothetical protein [Escherichia coli]HAI5533988.1 hypothetical protein [Escherichia coli]HAN2349705.1 hypothetical protein [Escherichia coli]